ncbi:hypothetical protein P692DRAFT_20756977 [Suillus brevipes Sb2]|nr:hypothetical protein P692DRAFT_20756977 [Suillus brevipes Sb2]
MSQPEKEDIQTSHDANLFDDDDDEMEDVHQPAFSQTTTRMDKREASQMDLDDAKGQPSTDLDTRERVKTVSDKRRIKEVDYSLELREMVYSQTEQINNMKLEMEKGAQNLKNEHMRNIEVMKQQWEAQQEAQRTIELERQASRAELEDHLRRSREAVSHANHEAVEASVQKILEDGRKQFEQELAQREDEFSRKKEEEFREHENVRFREMEQRLKDEVEKLRAEKESELAKMDQRFSRSDRRQDNDVQMDRSPHPSPKSSGTPCLDTMKKLQESAEFRAGLA